MHPALIDEKDGRDPGATALGDFPPDAVHRLGIQAGRSRRLPFPASGRWLEECRSRRCADPAERSGECALGHLRVILFFWPIRASSWNQFLSADVDRFFAADFTRRAGNFF